MRRFRNILVYLPEGTPADQLLAFTRELLPQGGRITVADVAPPLPFAARRAVEAGIDVEQLDAQKRNRRLSRLVAPFRDGPIEIETEVLRGQPAYELSAAAEERNHDLVMKFAVGGKEGLFGTTAMRLYRNCPAPVWVMHPEQPRRLTRIAVAVGPPNDEEHVLLSRKLFDVAEMIAALHGSELEILHAWVPYGEMILQSRLSQEELTRYVRSTFEQVQTQLAALLPLADRGRVRFLKGSAENVIPRHVATSGVDLLIMGTVARAGLERLLIGNTAERLLRRAPCSIVAFKPEPVPTQR